MTADIQYFLENGVLRPATAAEVNSYETKYTARMKMDAGHPCPACGLNREPGTIKGSGVMPDPCLGGLIPGVAHACCGHGGTEMAYVTFGDYPGQSASVNKLRSIKGAEALAWLKANALNLATDPDDDIPL